MIFAGTCKNCPEVKLSLNFFVSRVKLTLPCSTSIKTFSTFCEEVLRGQEQKMGCTDSIFHFKTKHTLPFLAAVTLVVQDYIGGF